MALIPIKKWWGFRRALGQAVRAAENPRPADHDLVLVPCWRRPEFLWHCLENLTRTEGLDTLRVIFRPDSGYYPETLQVIRAFSARLPSYEIQFPTPCPYRRTKQSANLLLGYLQAASVTRRFIFLIEEDVMVARDFFRWHRAVHAVAGGLFCSIAAKNAHSTRVLPKDAESFYLNSGDYCSYGVCFNRQVLGRWLAPHVNLSYMRAPKRYLRRHFPNSSVGLGFVEQDGLLRRIQEQSGLPMAYPCLPRAFDAGFYGYNRPGGLAGSLQERIEALGDIIYSPEAMRAAAINAQVLGASAPIDLSPPSWKAQQLMEGTLADAPPGSKLHA